MKSFYIPGYFRLEELLSEESDRKAKHDKWQKIVDETSSLIKDSRSRLDEIKSKDPHTTPEIQEQLDEIQVRYQIQIMPFLVVSCFFFLLILKGISQGPKCLVKRC